MSVFNLKTAALAIAAGVGLSGCAYGPYGGLGVGVGYGDGYGYDPYYGDGYYGNGYYGGGYPYGYAGYGSRYGYGYGSPYYGWYDGFYYPGTGYYVYDRYRTRYRWNDAQRRYWERRRGTASTTGGVAPVIENWADFQNRTSTTNQTVRQVNNQTFRDRPAIRRQIQVDQQQVRSEQQQQIRSERQQMRVERQQQRQTVQTEVQQQRRNNRGGRNHQVDND
jgi:hypothetical protein